MRNVVPVILWLATSYLVLFWGVPFLAAPNGHEAYAMIAMLHGLVLAIFFWCMLGTWAVIKAIGDDKAAYRKERDGC